MKGNTLFVYRHKNNFTDVWVVFYRPIKIKKRLPRRLNEEQIVKLAEQLALFHKSCHQIRHTLPASSKTLKTDIDHLLHTLDTEEGKFEYRMYADEIREHAGLFYENCGKLKAENFNNIPVFIDWNIGNFFVSNSFKLYSRWDYDWFRIGSRMLDFYFLSRVVSDIGDRTVFSYYINPLMEDRFILFLKAYHAEFPLERNEILFLKEVYRFFILNYVIKDGKYFFHKIFATKLQREAYDIYLPSIEKEFDADKILKALNL
jgi:Ser/Thr protein kinase RdoA (MazF antagonist)